MKLSDAILLGSLLIKPHGGTLLHQRWDGVEQGCALGMACKAAGVEINDELSLAPITLKWPWTSNEVVPCPACYRGFAPHNVRAIAFITHIFDSHVAEVGVCCPQQPRWTLEQLIDWVRAHEPEEENSHSAELPATKAEVAV